MGKPQSSIARLESGNVRDPRISMFYQAAKALGINPAEILGWAFDQVESSSEGSKEDKDGVYRKLRITLICLSLSNVSRLLKLLKRF
ncbi:Helix-turn-helix [Pseudobacteriovorax antillogorgiicola]|uniref:Helix-turn-helix n=2 Tax=Pseudobacteriovorax antillogorgiicola TaxID=1513793 RepID=A0A1Y6B859_9BACT|nr:helix-turn-helix transcriptional regulator [Pseudobacteriovorax antillogorgiicola]TCS58731.1 helix-turn-helix protein [Pseudobacteriovorax antillogorgiicola]SME95316.1 Helix-turn-helix [Pseudobacteriovorax antillogorgiicola]